MQKLIFIDVDGTLTVPGTNIPPDSAIDALRKAHENGHVLFLCSGRNRSMLEPLFRYPFAGAVCSAGGYVFAGEKVLFDCPMDEDDFKTAMRLFRENGVFRTVEARDAVWCDEGIGEFLAESSGGNSEMIRWRRALEQDLGMRPIRQYDGSRVYKIIFMCADLRQLEPAREMLSEKYNFLFGDGSDSRVLNGELINRRFDKGRGVCIVAQALGFELADTIGFGDSPNDLEMLQTVGTSVCMQNGSALLKSASSLVCPAVDQNGLAWAFNELGLL